MGGPLGAALAACASKAGSEAREALRTLPLPGVCGARDKHAEGWCRVCVAGVLTRADEPWTGEPAPGMPMADMKKKD